jgi:NDP-sugar pyrophosphorylase family protein
MTIVIPMAGLSQRFLDAGYTLPKYMLYVGNKSLFNISVSSFSRYFESCSFLFIARDLYNTVIFIQKECELMGIKKFRIEVLKESTKGQAETVSLGLKMANIKDSEPITIFNIDTIRHGFQFPEKVNEWDGFLDVFIGEGKNWSYAKTENENSTRVIETTEKVQISNYCSTGLYFFKSTRLYKDAFLLQQKRASTLFFKEFYIAPLYNILIQDGHDIHINLTKRDFVSFCGIPEEYIEYLKYKLLSE